MARNGYLKNRMLATTVNTTGDKVLTLYNTEVIRVKLDKIILDTGGYVTRMTADRINQASRTWGLDLKVYRHNGEMLAEYKNAVHPFINDRLELPR